MNQSRQAVMALAVVSCLCTGGRAQEVKTTQSKSWELQGSIQVQHLYNADIESDATQTNEGFRMRRGRFVARGKVTDYVETIFQIDVRDNAPRLKDAEGKIRLFDDFYLRAGQFKVPVWREELRSSTRLLLVERSFAAEFFIEQNLSARHIGVEFGRQPKDGIQFAFNLSNGAGEGGRETAGTTKDDPFINNGKLLTGRINVPIGSTLQLGLSGAANYAGNRVMTPQTGFDSRGTITAILPDFGVYFPLSGGSQFDIEGGAAFGSVDSDLFDSSEDDRGFTLFDLTGRWLNKWTTPMAQLGGMEAIELAAGFTFLEENSELDDDEVSYLRFGPAFYFGKSTRIQVNGEIEMPQGDRDGTFQVRTQAGFVF